MLKAFVDQHDDDWDECLQLLLFAYREVPVADYGYSSYEMLFGRHIRGSLKVVYDNWWEHDDKQVSKHVVTFMQQIRDKLTTALDTVHKN
jgi:hypothetical protein